MLITRYFVFVHLPKTGGTWVRKVVPDEWVIQRLEDHHAPHRQVPAEFRSLPTIAFVRNPWDWYLSWFGHVQRDEGIPEWMRVGDTFEEFLRALLRNEHIPFQVGDWMREYDLDFYTASFRDYVSPIEEVSVRRFENLRTDLLAFLEEHAEVTPELRATILTAPKENAGPERNYRDHYTEELAELVRRRCPLARQFGYRF